MGQIVFNGQRPTLANKKAITGSGSQANTLLADGEVWLIDSTVDSASSTDTKSSTGTGKYNKYIKGDGHTVAKNLPLLDIDPGVPTSLSELADDATHRLVTDEDKQRWNSGTGGGGTPVASSEDITVITDSQEGINRLQFADKEYDSSKYSGLGRVYLKKNIQTVPIKTSETLFNAFNATAIYNASYDNGYNAKYRELIEAGTYDADGKTAANAAYTTAYNNAIATGKTTDVATNLGNAAYVKAYNNAIKGDEDAEAAVSSVNTASNSVGVSTGNAAWSAEYPGIVAWGRRKYINGNFTISGEDKYINLSPVGRFSMTYCRVNVHAGEIYKIFAKKTDEAGGVRWITRFWMITETPAAGATQAKVLQAYKIDNENFVEGQHNETVFIEVEHDGVLWINYNTYVGSAGQCKIERISDTLDTIDVNTISGLNADNTEYIIQYDYDLNGGLLNIPKDSILRFNGGSIKNGYIVGNNSTIAALHSEEILKNITLLGTWTNRDFYPKWFGAVADGVTDDTDILQQMLDIAPNIGSKVNLIWYNNTFRTTRQLYLKHNTSIKGGTIKAKFANQMSWILKTYNYVATSDKVYGDSNPGSLVSWQEHDGGSVERIDKCAIEDLSLIGEYNQHSADERYSIAYYTPIFGGLCLMATDTITRNVTIRNTAIGLTRGACLKTYDDCLDIQARFVAFAGYAINGHSIRDSYLNVKPKTQESGTNDVITPYFSEYRLLATTPKSGFVYRNGGVDTTDVNNLRPYACNIQLSYAGSIEFDAPEIGNNYGLLEESSEESNLIADNVLVDNIAEVFLCATAHSNVTIRHPWLETVSVCHVYSTDSAVTVQSPAVFVTRPTYDIYAVSSKITLSGCAPCGDSPGITCSGGTNGQSGKYYLNNSRVNVLDARVSPYPTDDDRFYFLTAGNIISLPVSVIPSSGTGSLTNNTLNAASGTYYRFSYTVNTLTVNLPNMTGVSTVRPVVLYIETGENPNVTFTSPDNKTVTQYSNYEIDMNSKYEINCLFNGQKWIIAAAVVD